jgi:hypothetical protein
MTVKNVGKADVVLSDWNILQAPSKDDGLLEIFVGYCVNDGFGRMSTLIQSFDEANKTGITKSGSTYSLVGEPGMPHEDAIFVLEARLGYERVHKELFSSEATGLMNFKYPIK